MPTKRFAHAIKGTSIEEICGKKLHSAEKSETGYRPIVTATAHNEIFDAKIRSRSDVAPKHVKGERPVRNCTAKS